MDPKESMQLQPSEENMAVSFKVRELKFHVPWGHIAAKVWGVPHGQPVLAVHGMQDNAGSFDTLVPLLLRLVGRPVYIVCMDLPGHGFSSHLPAGIQYRFTEFLISLRRVIAQLGWHQFHFLGHSLGGLLGYYLAASYPDMIVKLITIDAVFFRMYPQHLQVNMLRAYGDKLLDLESKERDQITSSSYTLQQILSKIADGRRTRMTEEGLNALASRNIKAVEGKEEAYQFSTDRRISFINFPIFYEKEAEHLISQIKCQVLIVTASTTFRPETHQLSKLLLEAVKKNCSYFKHHVVEGDHDVHLNFPERVAPLVAKFLCEPSSSL